ncbi:MAG: hypothetical protein LUH10_09740 [Tannerellaceae bacterium]|nr:hypothetical protein [Tannerellaceae bacterium]MCD8043332.1 hypothetical protein [Tannerellaceae bacterium]
MALKYHLVKRRDLRKGKSPDATCLCATVRSGNRVDYTHLKEFLALMSSASVADITPVLRALKLVMTRHLLMGNSIQFSDLGWFRLTAGSIGVEEESKFHPSMFKRPRIVYTPGVMIRDIVNNLKYKPVAIKEVKNADDCPLLHVDD